MKIPIGFLCALMLGCAACGAQQQVDATYQPAIEKPLFAPGKGPRLLIDAGHHNFHTLDDKYAPFGKVAAADGFRVEALDGGMTASALQEVDILVIANAVHEKNADKWEQPVLPAFSADEVRAINDWVSAGGRLFLIADHMPFAGAAASLAGSFGFTFYDGFALRDPKRRPDIFTFAEHTLRTGGLTSMHHQLDSIATFTGQAFLPPASATSYIVLDSAYTLLLPKVAWEFDKDTRRMPAAGLSQLATLAYGSGKVVVSAEAAMFTAQIAGGKKFGLNAAAAPHNLQLLLNILEWLAAP